MTSISVIACYKCYWKAENMPQYHREGYVWHVYVHGETHAHCMYYFEYVNETIRCNCERVTELYEYQCSAQCS